MNQDTEDQENRSLEEIRFKCLRVNHCQYFVILMLQATIILTNSSIYHSRFYYYMFPNPNVMLNIVKMRWCEFVCLSTIQLRKNDLANFNEVLHENGTYTWE